MKEGIVWLVSYPKSGNTWFRIFLTCILNASKADFDLNRQRLVGTGSSACFLMDRVLGFDSILLSDDELDRLRPDIYNWYAYQGEVYYFKMHDARYTARRKTPIVNADRNSRCIYFIRNPLDVAISLAHHMNCSIDEAILMMNNPFLALKGSATRPHSQTRQVCSSWSMHVNSWLSASDVNILVLRYEDMHANPHQTFAKALRFLEYEIKDEDFLMALQRSNFHRLQQDEQQHGFRESAADDRLFFRKGIVGDWQHTLTEKQIEQIISNHGDLMARFSYIDEQQKPIYQDSNS